MSDKDNESYWQKKFLGGALKEMWDEVSGFFTIGFEYVWYAFPKAWEVVLDLTINRAKKLSGGIESATWELMLNDFVVLGAITEEQKDLIMKMKDKAHPFDWGAFIAIYLQMFMGHVKQISLPGQRFIEQNLNAEFRSNLPEYRDLIGAAFIAPEKTGEVREVMARHGIPEEMIDLLFLANYRVYDETTISMLWLRGVLSDDEMFMRMRELGYTDTRIKEIVQTWSLLPSPNDLFYMVAHEAFEPDIYQSMGLDAEFPVEQVEWLRKQGISEEWARKYWIAHWEQPSIQQGYEMLHRGVIGFEELNVLFKTVEIPPYWRDKLTAIAYQPYTRVDVRRMHDMGVLNDEEVFKAYKDLGYDDEKALNMLRFTLEYNAQNDKELTMSQIKSSYKERAIDKFEAMELLKGIGYSEDHADYLLTFEDYLQAKELQDDMIDNIRDRYQNNLSTLSESETALNQLGLPGAQIKVLLDKWSIKVYSDRKVPSKSDLSKFLRNGIIDSDQYRREMEKLGYNYMYAEWFERLANIDKPR